jgi:hypothetical protein
MSKTLRIAVLAAAFVAIASTSAHAAFWDSWFGKKQVVAEQAPEYYIHDDKSFEENTSSIHMRPFNSTTLEFDVRLPKNWTAEDLTKNQAGLTAQLDPDQKMVGNMAKMTSEMISVYRIELGVTAQSLKEEITAENWLKGFIFQNGYAIQGEVKSNGPYRAAVSFSSVSDQTNFFTYMTIHITGGYVFIVHCEVPLQIKNFALYVQKKVVDSLQVSYPRDQYVEGNKSYALVDSVRFTYPVSWQPVNPDFKDMTHLSVQLQDKDEDGTVTGFIRILAARRTPETNLVKEAAILKQHLSSFMKLNVNNMITSSQMSVKVNPRFMFSREEVYRATYEKESMQEPELRLAVFGDKDWYVFMYMLSPKEGDNLASWAHNMRTFQILEETMR